MRNSRFSEESASPSAAQTLLRPFFSRVQSRSGSISTDQLSRIKAAFGNFKTQMSAFIGRKPRPVFTAMHLKKMLKRRVQPVNIHLASESHASFSDLEAEDSAQSLAISLILYAREDTEGKCYVLHREMERIHTR
jgi:CRISPR/Cas system CSM-associated protein Csm2 small subunit